jgi:hypothetical protein
MGDAPCRKMPRPGRDRMSPSRDIGLEETGRLWADKSRALVSANESDEGVVGKNNSRTT